MSELYDQIMENPEALADFTYDQGYQLSSAQLSNFHHHWLQKRLEDLRPQVPVLDRLATEQGVDAISSIDDAAPLLFAHTVYKSYPMSYLEKGRFEALTRWLGKLTTTDLSTVDASAVATIDDWLDEIKDKTELLPVHTSGTSGKLSFFPRTKHQTRLMSRLLSNAFRDWDGPNSRTDMLKEPLSLITPTYHYGAGSSQRGSQIQVEMFAGGMDNALFLYPGQRLSADLLSLAGRLRVAEARGEQGAMEVPSALLRRREELIEQEKQRPHAMQAFLKAAKDRFSGQDIYVAGIYTMFYDWAAEGLANGYKHIFGPNSVMAIAGGLKGRELPENWRDTIHDFFGFDTTREIYAMTEGTGMAVLCEEGHYHLSPLTVPFLLDPKTGQLLPRKDNIFGRFAFFDILPDNYWAGMVTGDAVTMSGFEVPCKCGRSGHYVNKDVHRFSELEGGDDKVLCSGAPEAHDEAAAFLTEGL